MRLGCKLTAASIKRLVVLFSELRLLLPLIFVVEFMVCGLGRWGTFNKEERKFFHLN